MTFTEELKREHREQLRKIARRLREQRPDTMYGLVKSGFLEYVWAPVAAVLQHLWLKLALTAPLLVWLFQIGWGVQAQERALEMMQIRYIGHLAISFFVLGDMISRSLAATFDPDDTADPRKWVKSFGKLFVFNLLTYMLGVLANYGNLVALPYAEEASLAILVCWVVAICLSEFWSAAKNSGVIHMVFRAFEIYKMASGEEEVTEENIEEAATDGD